MTPEPYEPHRLTNHLAIAVARTLHDPPNPVASVPPPKPEQPDADRLLVVLPAVALGLLIALVAFVLALAVGWGA